MKNVANALPFPP
jgi:hypothetical protein